MMDDQYAVYQLKVKKELLPYRARSYQYLREQNFPVIVQNYQQAYLTKLFAADTPDSIRKRLEVTRPNNFCGRPFGIGDVIVLNRKGEATAYFVDRDSLVVIAGFVRTESSGILVTLDTKNFQIDGCAGTWLAVDECMVGGQHFFLMQHEGYGDKAPFVVVDTSGRLVTENVRKGFDEATQQKILEHLHPVQKPPLESKKALPREMEQYQKFYENGEYVRVVESTMEQSYSMVDGCVNNLPKPRVINGRKSVLDRLSIRKMERAAQRGGNRQEQAADLERRRK